MTTAKDIMVQGGKVLSFSPDSSVSEVIVKLAQTGYSGGPVVDGGKVVGVISESDIITLADKSDKDDVKDFVDGVTGSKLKARDIMSKNVISVGPGADLAEIAGIMSAKKINRVVVVDTQGALLGLIARNDIVEAAVREL